MKKLYIAFGTMAVVTVCLCCWGGAIMYPILGRMRSDVAGTLAVTAGESQTCISGKVYKRTGTMRVEGEGGTTDNLDRIESGVTGDILFLSNATAAINSTASALTVSWVFFRNNSSATD